MIRFEVGIIDGSDAEKDTPDHGFFALDAVKFCEGVDDVLVSHGTKVALGVFSDMLDESLTRNGFVLAEHAKLVDEGGDEIVVCEIVLTFELHGGRLFQPFLLPAQATV